MAFSKLLTDNYYYIKPLLPRRFQIWLRGKIIHHRSKAYSAIWPVLQKAAKKPGNWQGWPQNKRFALILTHDVDTARGQDRCYELMKLEKYLGFRSAFNFVPERYRVSSQIRENLVREGFEIGVHGLNHDGKLYSSKSLFLERAVKINRYLKEWNAVGFRSPAMHHNLDWIHDLNIEYDASTFDTDPFEPQSDGVSTIFPFWVANGQTKGGYVELPYTLPQDFTLFVLMREQTIDIWKRKLDWIAAKGGMALVNVHPDYINFKKSSNKMDEYPWSYYEDFLIYLKTEYKGQYWHSRPHEIAKFWVNNIGKIF